ncbi:hypothetical protein JZO70_18760 [Enterococcus sp. 669A]|uniref:Uncharacterized protein n=1 Tax=Candidatus Enterococcus moelleringii TaxID=2815325 RepID=A0ABS3LF15_9ENTE|nr:polysialyltransferase family glycosyltransferase [Enterococcus sp. 669A]MBO1308225.1 hypothetical protein [Enterococcus sp. 669A]
MIAFIAWTPLHLINCMNVRLNFFPEEKADLYIYDEFADSNLYYERIKKINMFNRVILVDHTNISVGMLKYYDILFNKNRFKVDGCIKYDEIFVQGGNYFSKILFSNNQKINPKLKLNYIEDGIAPYLGGRIFSTSRTNILIYNLFNRFSMLKKEIDKYFVYEPELVDFPKNKTMSIPKITKSNPAHDFILGVFTNDLEIENAVVFIDQPLKDDNYGVDEIELANRVSDMNKTTKNFVVKQHPRSNRVYSGFKLFNSNVPFEILALRGQLRNSIVISPSSTIAFSSYMMFGIEFDTVLLSQLILNEYKDYDTEHRKIFEMISTFTKKFNNVTEKEIFLPSNYNEFEKKFGEWKRNE